MRSCAAILMGAGLSLFALGCSEETQLRNAENELREEQVETQQTINSAVRDGAVTPSEQQEIREERAEDVEAAGDVAEQAGDVVEERND